MLHKKLDDRIQSGQPFLSFANTEFFQVSPDLLQADDLARVDLLIELLPMEYTYAQRHEWTIPRPLYRKKLIYNAIWSRRKSSIFSVSSRFDFE